MCDDCLSLDDVGIIFPELQINEKVTLLIGNVLMDSSSSSLFSQRIQVKLHISTTH